LEELPIEIEDSESPQREEVDASFIPQNASGGIRGSFYYVGGIACAVIAGYFASTNMVPYAIWIEETKGLHPSIYHFTLSQCLGIFFGSTIYVICASLYFRLCRDQRTWPRQPQMASALAAGSMWACGFATSAYGVKTLGMSIGYVMTAVLPVAVSALWTQLYFQEIRNRRDKVLFWTAIGFQGAGVALDIIFHPP